MYVYANWPFNVGVYNVYLFVYKCVRGFVYVCIVVCNMCVCACVFSKLQAATEIKKPFRV